MPVNWSCKAVIRHGYHRLSIYGYFSTSFRKWTYGYDFSPQRPGWKSSQVHVGFVVDKLALGQALFFF